MPILDSITRLPKVKKKVFKSLEPELRRELVALQQKLRQAKIPVMVVFAGVDTAGKHEMVNRLIAWMDPRWVITQAYSKPHEAEQQRPEFWRFWRDLPRNGQIGLYLSAWYSNPLLSRVKRQTSRNEFEKQLKEIQAFERTLTENGVLLLKVWMHLNKKCQRERLEALAASPETEWKIKPGAWENWGLYDRFAKASEKIIASSQDGAAPWLIVDGRHQYARELAVAHAFRDAIGKRLKSKNKTNALTKDAWDKKMQPYRGTLSRLKLNQSLETEEYKAERKRLQSRLVRLQHQAQVAGISTVLVFEGQDAAGKGGAIRRLVQGLDAQRYQVIPIAAPNDEELAHHYLWRFWRHLPRGGRVTIFDRSWYGRVLVERVEGFADDAAWQRAYQEINEFENQLVNRGTALCKFWIQIDKDEQLERFQARQRIPYKNWKITDEDWRNRERWDDYIDAVEDMVALTQNLQAPWVLVEGNDKSFARIKVLKTVCQQLEAAIDRRKFG